MSLNILLLCNKPNVGNDANTIVDHIEAFEKDSKHTVWLYSNLGDISSQLDLNRFDVVMIHYSLCLLNDYYLSKKSKKRLRDYSGLKVVFVQDEYRQINRMIDELAYLRTDVLFTCFSGQDMERIYSKEKLPLMSKYNNLTGYIPRRLTEIHAQPNMADRPIHVGYRGRKLPFWYGELAYEKWNIVEKWMEMVGPDVVKTDLSYHEKDRIYGKDWVNFLSSCKATLGVESGASVMDFTGDLEKIIDAHQLTHPNESFYQVQQRYLLPHEGQYHLNQISPRCFEAIALKTVLVLYEGSYSGILSPGRHYIELKKDFSNIEEVLRCLQDDEFLQQMADTAYAEIGLNPAFSYASFIAEVDRVIQTELTARSKVPVVTPYMSDDFNRAVKHLSLKSLFYKKRLALFQQLPVGLRLVVKGIFRPHTLIKQMTQQFFRLIRS